MTYAHILYKLFVRLPVDHDHASKDINLIFKGFVIIFVFSLFFLFLFFVMSSHLLLGRFGNALICYLYFQASNKSYHYYNDFLDAVEDYETCLEEHRVNEAKKIAAKYLTKIKTGEHIFEYHKLFDLKSQKIWYFFSVKTRDKLIWDVTKEKWVFRKDKLTARILLS